MYQAVVRNAERSKSKVPPYDFIELVGKGGHGRVYNCRRRSNGALVAVKIINIDDADLQERFLDEDNTISRFRREIAILQELRDNNAKNINIIHDAFGVHNQLWTVRDYCMGGSLRTLMRADPRRGCEEAFIVPVARELAVAMKSVRDIGVIHRDIKCAKVYVNGEGEIQLGDFGIVGVVGNVLSKGKTIVGTPHYLPLGVHSSHSCLTNEAYGTEIYIWSFGITIYEMATSLPPYTDVAPDGLTEATANALRLEPKYGGGQRQSLFSPGGAAPSVALNEAGEVDGSDDAFDWNFNAAVGFNADIATQYSHIDEQDVAKSAYENSARASLPPIATEDISRFQEVEQHIKEISATRREHLLDRLFDRTDTLRTAHTGGG
ncbi:hypothetical protein LTR56_027313 [Elasticomyces elasticus]|nr:hypothetical protein LTR56_027313 [Elasticomyces elasticus]KAK3615582.1 hypothetical protein LTR22_027376 [Elasticomyces elasticus]KAK4904592.1 hypothetical protein LTR49_025975 [Elasticomyces elasticus]